MTDIMYRVEGDYLIPELILDGEGRDINRNLNIVWLNQRFGSRQLISMIL